MSIHGAGRSRPEVDRRAHGAVRLEREHDPLDDVAHVGEVARLAAVLEDHRRPPVQEPRREDRGDARVRVRQRLPRPVDVEQAQRDGRDPVGRARDERELLLVALRDRVDRGRDQRLRLARGPRRRAASRNRGRGTPTRARAAAPRRAAAAPPRRARGTRTRPRRRSTSTRRRRAGTAAATRGDQALEEGRRRQRVLAHVRGDLVHRLPDAHRRGEMHDAVGALERAVDERGVGDVSLEQLDSVRQAPAARHRAPAPRGCRARPPRRRPQRAAARGASR